MQNKDISILGTWYNSRYIVVVGVALRDWPIFYLNNLFYTEYPTHTHTRTNIKMSGKDIVIEAHEQNLADYLLNALRNRRQSRLVRHDSCHPLLLSSTASSSSLLLMSDPDCSSFGETSAQVATNDIIIDRETDWYPVVVWSVGRLIDPCRVMSAIGTCL